MYLIDNKNKIFNHSDYIFFIIIAIVSLFLFIFKLPFPGTDDLVYKQAGASLAKGLGFAVPGLKGCLPGIEKLFAHCPPLYPFLYGIWFSIFGFSFSSSLALSFLICYSIMLIYLLLFKSALKKNFPAYLYGLIFFSWCNAITAIDRPDTIFVLLALSILLILIYRVSKWTTFKTQISIIILLGLLLASSLGLGMLFIAYLFFYLISLKEFNRKIIRTFFIWSFFGFVLLVLIWWIPIRSNPYLAKVQFIEPQVLRQALGGLKNISDFIRNITQGYIFTFYRTFHYIPLIIFLTIFFIVYILLYGNKDEKRFLLWQFLGIVLILFFLLIKLTHKCTYISAFLIFLIFIYGITLVRVIENIKNLYLKKRLIFSIFFLLFIACAPIIRMVIFPLTWQKEDTYNYNKKLIINNIKKGSKVLTDVIFWYMLNEDYEIFDAYFTSLATDLDLYSCSHVLLRSGGSGIPDLAVLQIRDDQRHYFYENFTKQLSTLSDEPNKIFGLLPISRSRWCYRFELYRRK